MMLNLKKKKSIESMREAGTKNLLKKNYFPPSPHPRLASVFLTNRKLNDLEKKPTKVIGHRKKFRTLKIEKSCKEQRYSLRCIRNMKSIYSENTAYRLVIMYIFNRIVSKLSKSVSKVGK